MNSISTSLIDALWRASWQGSIFIVAVWVVCRMAKRLPPTVRQWLWWIACLQFVVRLLVSPFALPLLPAPAPVTESAEALTGPALDVQPSATALVFAPNPAPPAPPMQPTWPNVFLASVWSLGVVAGLAMSGLRLFRTRRLLRASTLLEGVARNQCAELSSRLGIREPRLAEASQAPCPLVFGWLRPIVVLPTGFAERCGEAELRMAIAHELSHVRRGDLWTAAIPFVARTLFFFHPLAWLAVSEATAATEAACDLAAMQLSGSLPSAYARLLLRSAQRGPSMAALGAAFGFRLLKRRISMLSQSNTLATTRVRRSMIGLVALAALFAIPWSVTAQATVPTQPPQTVAKPKVTKHHPKVKHHVRKTKAHGLAVARKVKVAAPATHRSQVIVGTVAPQPAGVSGTMAVTRTPQGLVISPATRADNSVGVTNTAIAATFAGSGVTTVAAPLTGVGSVKPGQSVTAPSPVVVEAAEPAPMVEYLSGARVNVSMRQTPVVVAIRALMKGAHLNYSIKATVTNTDLITCDLNGVDARTALETILESARQPLTYRVVDGIYMIEPKP